MNAALAAKRGRALTILIALIALVVTLVMAYAPQAQAASKPGQVKSVSVKAVSGTSLKIGWKKVSKAKGYQIRYSTKSNMSGAKVVKVKGGSKKSVTITKLDHDVNYYVQVRAYKTTKLKGKWSKKIVGKAGHVYKTIAAKPATLMAAGHTPYRQCMACGLVVGKNALAIVDKRSNTDAYSWDELKFIANKISACENQEDALDVAIYYNLCPSDGKLTGNETKSLAMAVNDIDGVGSVQTVQVQIVGFYHDDLADGSGKAGITFGFKDIVGYANYNNVGSNKGGWDSSNIWGWIDTGFREQLPANLSSNIAYVTKMTNNTGKSEDPAVVTATIEGVWLFSMVECYGESVIDLPNSSNKQVYLPEGTQYQLYKDNDVTISNCSFMAKSLPGSEENDIWWFRTPNAGCDFAIRCATTTGEVIIHTARQVKGEGVSPGFCF